MTVPALALEQVTRRFGAVTAVDGVSFTVAPGEMFALLGPNGAGKSTTLHLISGAARLRQGRIQVFGHDVVRDYRTTRWITGVMPQEIIIDHFFDMDRALRIHAGYYGLRDDPAWRATLVDRLELGPHLHKPMVQLSGGMKRRFMVAKALIHRPRLLILDEPTAGVDVDLRHGLWEFIREINRQEGVTVLLTTHYLEEAEALCDRIAILHRGRLVALDRTRDLVRRCGPKQLVLHLAAPLAQLPPALARPGAALETSQRLRLPLAAGETAAVLAAVQAAGLEVADLEVRDARLEDVFLDLTGRRNGRAESVRRETPC